jgi:FkbM family methyltransferase
MPTTSFLTAYAAEIAGGLAQDYGGNYDENRFGPEVRSGGTTVRLRGLVRSALRALHLQSVGAGAVVFNSALRYIDGFVPQLEWLFGKLADDESRSLLVQLVAYRALGHRRVRLPLSNPSFWRKFREFESQTVTGETIPAQFLGWNLQRLNLQRQETPTTLFTTPMAAYVQFALQQCRCETVLGPIEARGGDYVIDGGGGWGDTAIYFAERIGEPGRVATFEFVPGNLEIMTRNLALNPHLAQRVEPVQRALWCRSDVPLRFAAFGPGTTVAESVDQTDALCAQSLAIDDFISGKNWPRLDFIKLDVEGAELSTLQGAEKSMRRFKPRLAIALYHRFEDFFTIPSFIDSLDLNYRFYLRHFTIHAEETMLFARAE